MAPTIAPKAHLVWRRNWWHIMPRADGNYLTDKRSRPRRFKTIESARAALEAAGYELDRVIR